MCGIFGAIGPLLDVDAINVESTLSTMAHRGPDGRGVWSGSGVLLGHLRLAIIDLTERGHQPMRDDQRGVTLTYNGEVYNYRELRRELEAAGVAFASESDTEVILAGYIAWGVGIFERINGMFAIALHDARNDTLLLARDHAGIKPLYYAVDLDGCLYFASEIKGIPQRLRGVRDDRRMGEYLYFGTNHIEHTLLEGINKLLPGTYAIYDHATTKLTHHRYWSLPVPVARRKVLSPKTTDDLTTRLRALLHAAVGRQLISDRPVGVFLSGGVDSSAIACVAAKGHGRKLDMFTARFRSSPDDTDVRLAAQLSTQLGCPHHVIDIDDHVDLTLVDDLLDQFDGPFADAAAIPLTLLSHALPRDMKVILQGDGGDELFGGYARYRYLAYRDRIGACSALLARTLRWFGSRAPGQLSRRWRRIACALGECDDAIAVARLLTVEFPEDAFAAERIAKNRARRWCDPFAAHRAFFEAATGGTIVDKALAVDFHTILPDFFLEKVDRATMAASIEVRVPMLDREIVEFAARLPATCRMPDGRPKGLLRDTLTGLVPDFVLDAPKRGFGVPYGAWIRGPLAEDVRAELKDCEGFDRRLVGRMLDEHLTGKADHAFMLWKLFLLIRWMRRLALHARDHVKIENVGTA